MKRVKIVSETDKMGGEMGNTPNNNLSLEQKVALQFIDTHKHYDFFQIIMFETSSIK